MSNKILNKTEKKDWIKEILRATLFIFLLIIFFQLGKVQSRNNSFEKINLEVKPLNASNPREKALLEMQSILETQGFPLEKIYKQPVDNENSTKTTIVAGETNNKDCVFIGSSNSNKYHLPDSSWADRIKPENRICFESEEDAKKQGYEPSSSILKSKQ